jgi:hypothetical protein
VRQEYEAKAQNRISLPFSVVREDEFTTDKRTGSKFGVAADAKNRSGTQSLPRVTQFSRR